jgi:hypothetical protein
LIKDADAAKIDQGQTSDDEHGAERRHRNVLQRCSEEQQHKRHRRGRHEPNGMRSSPCRIAHGGA